MLNITQYLTFRLAYLKYSYLLQNTAMKSFQSFFTQFPNSFIQNGKHKISYVDFFRHSQNLQKAFAFYGIAQGEILAIVSQPCIEWILCDVACIKSQIVTIPLFHNSSSQTLTFQFQDAKPQHIILENDEVLEKILACVEYKFSNIFLIHKSKKFPEIKTIWQIIEEHHEVELLNHEISQSEVATIIYTSGTSGSPKGVVLTFLNLAHQISDIHTAFFNAKEGHTAISILPLAHVYQRTIIHFFLSKGVNIIFVNDITNVLRYITKIEPNLITIVPRVLEKVYSKIKSQIEDKPRILRKLLLPLFEIASSNPQPNMLARTILEATIFKKVRRIFGRNMACIVCGGAKLNEREEIFFRNAKLPFFQGYGMTECSPVIASNITTDDKIFTVGKPFSSVEVCISEVGEICVRGGSIFSGYLNHEKRNPQEFFHTGDLGKLNSDGFLSVTGRLKDQCKNANGKFVDIVKIEGLLNEISGVENSCVIAEGKPYTVAILFTQRTDFEAIMKAMHDINSKLEHWERVQYIHTTIEKPTVENGIITPSMKIRRNDIVKKYCVEIEGLYSKKR